MMLSGAGIIQCIERWWKDTDSRGKHVLAEESIIGPFVHHGSYIV